MRISRRDCNGASTLLLAGCGAPKLRELASLDMPPHAPREFQSAWVQPLSSAPRRVASCLVAGGVESERIALGLMAG